MIIGSGVDIIEIERLKSAIERWGEAFLKRVFTAKEVDYSKKRRFPYEHLAARFAAKEAVLKALSNYRYDYKDIEITNNGDGKPVCNLKHSADELTILLSISHTKNYAVASAIITKGEKRS
ncbi:holo-ACP synthase [Candidatus Omnitrophota bacterium]